MQKFQLSRELCKYRGTIIDDAFLYVVRFFNSLSTNSLAVTDSISASDSRLLNLFFAPYRA